MRNFALGMMLVVPFSGWASGNEHGNGGSVILCPKFPVGTKAEVYDLYEGAKRGFDVELGAPSLRYDEKIAYALDRLAKINPSRAKLYRHWFAEFQDPANTEFTKDDLVEIPDIGAGTIPRGCTLKQAAAQRKYPLPGDKRYLVDEKIWHRLDANNRAALVLHELIYREAVLDGHEDSAATRYLNAVILSSRVGRSTPRDMFNWVSPLGFRLFDAQGGISLSSGYAEFHANGLVKRGYVSVENLGFILPQPSLILMGVEEKVGGDIYFHPNGVPSRVNEGSEWLKSPCPRFSVEFMASSGVYLNEEGKVDRIQAVGYVAVAQGNDMDLVYFPQGYREYPQRICNLKIDSDGCPDLNRPGLVSELKPHRSAGVWEKQSYPCQDRP